MNFVKIGRRAIIGKGIRRVSGLGLSLALLLAGRAARAELDLGPAANIPLFILSTATNPPLLDYANQARAFSAEAASFTSLPNIGNVNGSGIYTFTAANFAGVGTYIVNINNLSVFQIGPILTPSFTLDGRQLPAGSRVIVNVANDLSVIFGDIDLIGLTPAQVLINYTGTSTAQLGGRTAGGGVIDGTVLAPNASFVADFAGIQGSLIVSSATLTRTTVRGIPFLGPIPEPSSVMAGVLLLLLFGASARRILRKSHHRPLPIALRGAIAPQVVPNRSRDAKTAR